MKDTKQDYQQNRDNYRNKQIQFVLNGNYTAEQKKTMQVYLDHLREAGMRLATQQNHLQLLKQFYKDTGKHPKDITKEDMTKYLHSLTERYAHGTITERRLFVIKFYKWYYDKEKEDINLIKNIIVKKRVSEKLPEDIFKPEEIKQLVQIANNFRDKCAVILLYETGARIGEFLQLKIKHIDLSKKEYGTIMIPAGKTNSRSIPFIYSIPHVNNWLNSHPFRDNPDAPLFVSLARTPGTPLANDGLKTLLKKLGKRAGIKKNIYPHLFRHSRMTELAKELKESELRIFAGWSKDSKMPGLYIHLSGSDVKNKILANAGLIDQAEIKTANEVLKGITCPRCEHFNSSESKYCKCGFCLDLQEVNKLLETRSKATDVLNRVMDDAEMQELFKQKYKNLMRETNI